VVTRDAIVTVTIEIAPHALNELYDSPAYADHG